MAVSRDPQIISLDDGTDEGAVRTRIAKGDHD